MKTCVVEAGYHCYGGSTTTKDTCYEICGDGKDYGQYECDDGNLLMNDGCSPTCKIEHGYECIKGSTSTASSCYEICGDGYDFGHYECDDKNKVSGDGCSMKTCVVETGFTCVGGT